MYGYLRLFLNLDSLKELQSRPEDYMQFPFFKTASISCYHMLLLIRKIIQDIYYAQIRGHFKTID